MHLLKTEVSHCSNYITLLDTERERDRGTTCSGCPQVRLQSVTLHMTRVTICHVVHPLCFVFDLSREEHENLSLS